VVHVDDAEVQVEQRSGFEGKVEEHD